MLAREHSDVPVLPSPHYKHVIVCGAREHKLPQHYIERLLKVRLNAQYLILYGIIAISHRIDS